MGHFSQNHCCCCCCSRNACHASCAYAPCELYALSSSSSSSCVSYVQVRSFRPGDPHTAGQGRDVLLQGTARAARPQPEEMGAGMVWCKGWLWAGSCRAGRRGWVQEGMMGWSWLDMLGLEVQERQDWAAERLEVLRKEVLHKEVLDLATCLSLPNDLRQVMC